MKYNVIWSNLVLRDMQDIETYIEDELANPSAARKLLEKFFHEIDALRDFPRMGSLYGKSETDKNEYRYIVCEKYLIFYFVEENTVNIARILYQKRDISAVLGGRI